MSGGVGASGVRPLMAVSDPARLRDLRRMKAFATGLLVLAAVVYLIARANEDDGAAWVGYVRAFAEAAMVGALADWFAVTALFRYPLGLPIPHTAIIPKRKDQIGRSLGEFVEGNFLTREVLAERLEGVHAGRRLGQWLAVPDHAERASGFAGDAAQGRHRGARRPRRPVGARRHGRAAVAPDRRGAAAGEGRRRLGRGWPPPAAARRRAHGLSTFLDENRATLRGQLQQESPWWVPEPVDDRIFKKIFNGVQHFLSDVGGDPDHEVRRSIEERCSPSPTSSRRPGDDRQGHRPA